MIDKKRFLFWDVLILVIIGLTPLLWFKAGYMINGGDTNFPLEPLKWFANRFFLWNSQYNAGLEYYYAPGGMFFHAIQAVLYFSGLSLITTEKIFVVLWFTAIAFSMYFLMTVIETRKPDRIARLIAVIFYCYNLYLLNPWSQIQSANLSAYVSTPIILALFIKGLRGEFSYFKAAVLIGLFSLIGSAAGINPPMFLVFVFVLVIYYLYFLINRDVDVQVKKRSIRFCFMTLAVFLLLNAYWILPGASEVIRKTLAQGTSITTFGTVNWLSGVSRKTSIINVARMMGAWDWYDGWAGESYVPYAKVYFTRLFFMIFGIFSVIFIYSSVLLVKNRNKFYFVILAVLGTLFSTGSHPPFGAVYLWFVRHLPLFSIFRSPWYKFSLMTALGYATLAGLTAGVIFDWLAARKKFLRISAVFFILFLVLGKLIYSFPFFSGEVIVTHKNLPSLLLKIPDYVFKSGEWIEKNTEDYRILSMPQGYDNYKWGWGSSTHIVNLLTKKPVLWGNIGPEPALKLRDICYEVIYKQSTPYVYRILKLLSTKYLLQRNDAWFDMQGGTDSPEFIKERLGFQRGIVREKTIGQWDFYKADDTLPHIFSASDISLVTGDIEALVPLSNTAFFDKNPCFVLTHQEVPPSILQWEAFNRMFLYDSWVSDFMAELLDERYFYAISDIEKPVNLDVDKEDFYYIWLKSATYGKTRNIALLADDKKFEFSERDLKKLRDEHPMLNYRPLAKIKLSRGRHEIYVLEGLKEKERHEFLIVPESKVEEMRNSSKLLLDKAHTKTAFLVSHKKMKTDTLKVIRNESLKMYVNEGFYKPETWDDKKSWRWLKKQMTDNVIIENDTPGAIFTNLRFTTYSFHRPRNLYLYLNGELLYYPPIAPNVPTVVDLENIRLEPGRNILSFYTPFQSDNIDDILNNGDFKDVTFAFKDDFELGSYLFEGEIFIPKAQKVKLKLYPHCPVTTGIPLSPTKKVRFANRDFTLKLGEDAQSYYSDEVFDLKKGLYQFSFEQDVIEKYFLEIFPLDLFEQKEHLGSTTEFQFINPTRYRIKLEVPKQAFLVFNESFNPEWKMHFLSSPCHAAEPEHFMVNGYANCWYFPQSGSYDVLLVFWPQVFFKIGSAISVLALFFMVGLVVIKRRTIRKRI